MLSHHLLTAFLQIKQNKQYAAINIIGLSIAFSAVLLITLFIRDELSYEHWLPNYERLYRVSAGGGDRMFNTGPSDLGLWVKQDFPQIEALTRFMRSDESFRYNDTTLNSKVTWADENIFAVLQFPILAGNLSGALNDPNSLVLTESEAIRYFGEESPLGKTLLLNGTYPMIVKAVINDLPSNTHLNVDILAPAHAENSPLTIQDSTPIEIFGQKLWATSAYFLLSPGESIEEIHLGVSDMLDRHAGMVESRKSSEIWKIYVTSIADIHLSPRQPDGRDRDLSQVFTVLAIGVLILLGAGVNFINIMTARGMTRAKEIGIRKTLGANRAGLTYQFLSETLLYVIISSGLACLITAMLMPPFNAFLQREISFDILVNLKFLTGFVLTATMIAVLAGIYPSLVLSSYPAGVVLKYTRQGKSAGYIRHLLIVAQFSILIALIIGTLVINRQTQFGISELLRQDSDPIVIVETPCNDPFKNAVLSISGVKSAACSSLLLQMSNGATSGMRIPGEEDWSTSVDYASVDEGYFEMYGIDIVAGRTFDRTRSTDFSPEENVWNVPEMVIINETAARNLGFDVASDAVGELVEWSHYFRLEPTIFSPPHEAEIIGVVKNFQRTTVHQEIRPGAFYMDPNQGRIINIQIDGQLLPEALEGIDRAWEIVEGDNPIERYFFDDAVEDLYQDLNRQGKMLTIHTGIAIFISILGLIGLAAFVAQRKTKEIGIRKVLGGKRGSIIALLLWQFAKPVIWANLIAWPAAYYFIDTWLEGFSRRINLEVWMFLVPSIIALTIAVFTVIVHTWYIANTDPVKALRYE